MIEIKSLVTASHVAAGAFALLLGLFPLLSAKGSTFHRTWGRRFVVAGSVVLLTAVIGDVFYAAPAALIAATVAAGYQFVSSLRALSLAGKTPGALDAGLALCALGACWAILETMGPGTPSWSPAIGYSLLGATGAVATYDLSRHLWPKFWSAHARPLDHGLKMTSAYFAMMSAGLGNTLRDLQPWSQIGPSILGSAACAILVVLYLRAVRKRDQSSNASSRRIFQR